MSSEPDTILIVTDVPFWRAEAGAHQRIGTLCRVLQDEGYDVAIFYPTHLPAEEGALFRARFPECTLYLPPPHLLALRLLRTKLGIRGPLLWERRRALRYLCLHCLPKFIIFQYLHTAPLRHKLERAVPYPIECLMDTLDVQHLRAASLNNDEAGSAPAITREEEAAQLEGFDAILAIQNQDAEVLRAMCPDIPVLVAGHSHAIHSPRPQPDGAVQLLFAAADGQHNVAAINGFLADVWPALRARHGDRVTLQIAGKIGARLDPAHLPAGVTLTGFVADLEGLYAGTHIVVNPVYAGSGLKIKNVEALCHGLPLVTTAVGAQGMEAGAGEAFILCDAPAAMTDALSELIDDPGARNRLAAAAHAFAQEHFSTATAYRELFAFLRGHS